MSGDKVCVLVVDDEPAFLRVLTAAIRLLDCDTVTAVDAGSALQLLSSRRPALILMDVRLPGTDGVELARRIRSDPSYVGVSVLLMSAYGRPQAVDDVADGFLPKPIQLDELPSIIGPYIEQ